MLIIYYVVSFHSVDSKILLPLYSLYNKHAKVTPFFMLAFMVSSVSMFDVRALIKSLTSRPTHYMQYMHVHVVDSVWHYKYYTIERRVQM